MIWLWLLSGIWPAARLARLAFRNPRWLTLLDTMPDPLHPRRKTQAPPRAHGGAGEPRTALESSAHETGARRLTVPDRLTIPFRLRRTEGEHTARAVAERTLIFDELRGRYRHAETGPMTLPQQYLDYAGKAREGWWPS